MSVDGGIRPRWSPYGDHPSGHFSPEAMRMHHLNGASVLLG
jgi:hypothetical protein